MWSAGVCVGVRVGVGVEVGVEVGVDVCAAMGSEMNKTLLPTSRSNTTHHVNHRQKRHDLFVLTRCVTLFMLAPQLVNQTASISPLYTLWLDSRAEIRQFYYKTTRMTRYVFPLEAE